MMQSGSAALILLFRVRAAGCHQLQLTPLSPPHKLACRTSARAFTLPITPCRDGNVTRESNATARRKRRRNHTPVVEGDLITELD